VNNWSKLRSKNSWCGDVIKSAAVPIAERPLKSGLPRPNSQVQTTKELKSVLGVYLELINGSCVGKVAFFIQLVGMLCFSFRSVLEQKHMQISIWQELKHLHTHTPTHSHTHTHTHTLERKARLLKRAAWAETDPQREILYDRGTATSHSSHCKYSELSSSPSHGALLLRHYSTHHFLLHPRTWPCCRLVLVPLSFVFDSHPMLYRRC